MIRILGIDPGLRFTGWGVIDSNGNSLKYVACGVIASDSKSPIALRILTLNQGLNDVIKSYRPDEVAIEETFVNKNPTTSLKLGHARGALMLTASISGFTPYEYAATLVKKSIVGVGRAEKGQVVMMVKQLLPTAEVTSEDAADALAVAICHLSHRKMNILTGKAV